jgi:hypothetical protein
MTTGPLKSLAFLTSALIATLLASAANAAESDAEAAEVAAPAAAPFDAAHVWQVHLELSPEEFAAVQPRGGGGFFGLGRAASAPPPKPLEDRVQELHRNQFGVDLPWAKGQITIGGQSFSDVGIRYKGNGTIMDASRTIKKSWKIELDYFGGTEKFLGLKTINLHCGVTDPTKCRETMAYGLYREAGVPAPRTTLAEVRLTVPGQYEKELLGIYTMVENVGGAFLRAHFGNDAGLLMKPEGVRDLEHWGAYWPAYKHRYAPKRDATDEESQRVIDFARLIHQSDDADFSRDIAEYLDVDEYLRFLAVTSYIANSDSFFVLGHNYFLYLHPETGQFHFIPWDLDRAFANFFILGSHEQQMDLSLKRPYSGPHRLTDRLLGIPEVAARYQTLLEELAAGCFDKHRLLREIAALAEVTKDLVAREKEAADARGEQAGGAPHGPPGMFVEPPSLETFVAKRAESVAAQVAGSSEGHVPARGFGPPGGGPPRGGPRRPPADAVAPRGDDAAR